MANWVPPLPAGYTDANRAFLQALMARGTLTFSEAQHLIAHIRRADNGGDGLLNPHLVTMDDMTSFVRTAREAVEALDFDIRVTRHQVQNNGERVWVFTNTHSDPPTQLATTHSPEEVAFIKRLLDAMFNEYNTPRLEVMAVSEAQALKVSRPPRSRESNANGQANGEASSSSTDRGLKHSEVLSLLSSLVAEGWLEKSRAKFYSLSPRALVELWSWLMETFNDPDDEWQQIKFCESCKEIVTYGQRCTERDCQVRLHDICEAGFWRSRDKKCPKCDTPWDGNHFVGERAITSRQADRQAERSRRSGGGRRSAVEAELDNQESDDEEA